MIHDGYRCIYIHVPKTGGTSIETKIMGSRVYNYQLAAEKHLSARQMKILYADRWNDYFKFVSIRNTWERIISLYHEAKHMKTIPDGWTFTEFVKSDWLDKRDFAHALKMITDENGKIMVDLIINFDHLESDFSIVANKLGLSDQSLPQIGVRDYVKDVDYWYTEETARLILDKFKDEIEYFGFKYAGKFLVDFNH